MTSTVSPAMLTSLPSTCGLAQICAVPCKIQPTSRINAVLCVPGGGGEGEMTRHGVLWTRVSGHCIHTLKSGDTGHHTCLTSGTGPSPVPPDCGCLAIPLHRRNTAQQFYNTIQAPYLQAMPECRCIKLCIRSCSRQTFSTSRVVTNFT